MPAKQTTTLRIIVLGVVATLFGTAVHAYTTTGNRLTPPLYGTYTTRPLIENPDLIENWLPATSYSYMNAQINQYMNANGLSARYISQIGAIDTNNGTYNFTLVLEPQKQQLKVAVRIINFSSIISTAVYINGALQGPDGSAQATNGQQVATSPQYTGLDALTNVGITDMQIQIIEDSLRRFAPSATSISIDTMSVGTTIPDPTSGTTVFSFSVYVDGTEYRARFTAQDISSGELLLFNYKTQSQIFDSGIINGQ